MNSLKKSLEILMRITLLKCNYFLEYSEPFYKKAEKNKIKILRGIEIMLILREITTQFCDCVNSFKKYFSPPSDLKPNKAKKFNLNDEKEEDTKNYYKDSLDIFKQISKFRENKENRKEISDNLVLFWKYTDGIKLPSLLDVNSIYEKIKTSKLKCKNLEYSLDLIEIKIDLKSNTIDETKTMNKQKSIMMTSNSSLTKDLKADESMSFSKMPIVHENRKSSNQFISFETKIRELKAIENEERDAEIERKIKMKRKNDIQKNNEELEQPKNEESRNNEVEQNIMKNKGKESKKKKKKPLKIIDHESFLNFHQTQEKLDYNLEIDNNNGKIRLALKFPVKESSLIFTINHKEHIIFVGTIKGRIDLYNLHTGAKLRTLPYLQCNAITSLYLSEENDLLISGDSMGYIYRYDLIPIEQEQVQQLINATFPIQYLVFTKKKIYFLNEKTLNCIDLKKGYLLIEQIYISLQFKIESYKITEESLVIIGQDNHDLIVYDPESKTVLITLNYFMFYDICSYNGLDVLITSNQLNELDIYSLADYHNLARIQTNQKIDINRIIAYQDGKVIVIDKNEALVCNCVKENNSYFIDNTSKKYYSFYKKEASILIGYLNDEIFNYN